MFALLIAIIGFFSSITHTTETACNTQFILITSLYNETKAERAQEYITCLEYNLVHPLIKQVHVMYDTTNDTPGVESVILTFIKNNPIIQIDYVIGRPSFGALFDCAAKQYHDEMIIISNGDIYFNETLELLSSVELSHTVLALGRWNIDKKGAMTLAMEDFIMNGTPVHRPAECSQDVWIFKAPIKIAAHDISLGSPHCDHYLAYRIATSGYALYNPSLSVQCCHLHASNIRNYTPGGKHIMPSAAIPACTVDTIGNPTIKPVHVRFGE